MIRLFITINGDVHAFSGTTILLDEDIHIIWFGNEANLILGFPDPKHPAFINLKISIKDDKLGIIDEIKLDWNDIYNKLDGTTVVDGVLYFDIRRGSVFIKISNFKYYLKL